MSSNEPTAVAQRSSGATVAFQLFGAIAALTVVAVLVWWGAVSVSATGVWGEVLAGFSAGVAGGVGALMLAPRLERVCMDVDIPVDMVVARRWIPAVVVAVVWAALAAAADVTAVSVGPALLTVSLLGVWAAWIDQVTLRFPLVLIRGITAVTVVLIAAAVVVDGDYAAGVRAVVAGVVLFALNLLSAIVTRGYPGLADVRLSFALGMLLGWFGWSTVFVGVLMPYLLALPVVVVTWMLRRNRREEVGFAPFLIAGAGVAICLALAQAPVVEVLA